MPINRRLLAALVLVLATSPAAADGLRDLCTDRPGLGTPACIVDRGHLIVETGLVDWTHTSDPTTRTDTVTFTNPLFRYGLTDTLEAEIGWDGYGLSRTRDKITGAKDRSDGAGDMTLALRQNLRNPDGSGFSLALAPFVTLPTGSDGFTAGDWGAGLIVPISFELNKTWSLALTPEIDAAVDEDGSGRHFAFGSVVGLSVKLSEQLTAIMELAAFRDEDPVDPSTTALASLALSWQPTDDLEFDVGLVKGLNSESPDIRLYTGASKRF